MPLADIRYFEEVHGKYCEKDDISYCKNDGICKISKSLENTVHCV